MTAALFAIIAVMMFVFGVVFGSFSNVLIYRLPLRQNIAFPASHCPKCGHPLKWYDNIPLLSFALLRGKCRYCHEKISPVYPIVEASVGVLFLLSWLKFGLQPASFIGAVALMILLVIAFIDQQTMEIPLSLNVALYVLAMAQMAFDLTLGPTRYPFYDYLIGLGVGVVLFVGLNLFSTYVLRKEAIGLGDALLFGSCGLYLGWQGLFMTVFLSSVFCSVVSIVLIACKIRRREDPIPFGPYIAFSYALAIFFSFDIVTLVVGLI